MTWLLQRQFLSPRALLTFRLRTTKLSFLNCRLELKKIKSWVSGTIPSLFSYRTWRFHNPCIRCLKVIITEIWLKYPSSGPSRSSFVGECVKEVGKRRGRDPEEKRVPGMPLLRRSEYKLQAPPDNLQAGCALYYLPLTGEGFQSYRFLINAHLRSCKFACWFFPSE